MKLIRSELFLWVSVATIVIGLTSCSGSESTFSKPTEAFPSDAQVSSSSQDGSSSNSARADSSQPHLSVAQLETAKPYINQLLPEAARIQQEQGIPVEMTLAIAILETGWGKHVIGQNNHFGLRCVSDDCVARVKRGRTIQYETCPDPSECFNIFATTVDKLTNGEVANIDKLAENYASGANWSRKVKRIQKRVRKILNQAREEANSA
ncbi:MAG: glucosaminidase domain-containing protein [Cyanophyceae cyanobacterium]